MGEVMMDKIALVAMSLTTVATMVVWFMEVL